MALLANTPSEMYTFTITHATIDYTLLLLYVHAFESLTLIVGILPQRRVTPLLFRRGTEWWGRVHHNGLFKEKEEKKNIKIEEEEEVEDEHK